VNSARRSDLGRRAIVRIAGFALQFGPKTTTIVAPMGKLGVEVEFVTGDSVKPSEGPGQTSTGLLQRVKARDQAAWERFVHLYSPLVYRWCRNAGLQEADAADVGQEVFRSVAGAIADFRHEPGATLRGWLRTITRNKVRDFYRRLDERAQGGSAAQERLRQLAAEESSEPEDADQDDALLVYRRAVDMILSEFSTTTREAFHRVVIERRQAADVAAELGITLNSVYLAKSRILRRIREEFDGMAIP
jgi:RNA polymerase sigma-70 factor (ECF subfamily)